MSTSKSVVVGSILAVIGLAGSRVQAQTLTSRSCQLNYNYVFGAGADSHTGSDLLPRGGIVLSDSDNASFQDSTSGVLPGGTPYSAGVSCTLHWEYAIAGTAREIQAITASASSMATAAITGGGTALLFSSTPGNKIEHAFRVQIAVPYRLSGTMSLPGGDFGNAISLQRFDGFVWQYVFTTAFLPGTPTSFDTSGTLTPGEYRLTSAIGVQVQGSQSRSHSYSYAFEVPERGSCFADLDDGSGTGSPDGGITIDDLLYYLVLFEAGALDADVDDGSGLGHPDGGVTIDDLLFFLLRFEQGC